MYAIIENGNKQYRVSEGDVLKVEKLKAEVGAEVSFPVLMVADESGIKLGEEVKSAIERLENEDERLLLLYRYIRGMKWEDIGEELHAGRSTLFRWHKSALSKIHEPGKKEGTKRDKKGKNGT